jgi:hypothetical protein
MIRTRFPELFGVNLTILPAIEVAPYAECHRAILRGRLETMLGTSAE